MRFVLYLSPTESVDLTDHIPQQGLSQLQADLHPPRASLELDVFTTSPGESLRKALRSPGILVIYNGDTPVYALHYNPVNLKYDPTRRRYTLRFTSILEALRTYIHKETWFNTLDAASLMRALRDFLAQYLPESLLPEIHPDGMSPFPEAYSDLHLAGFVQPASWLVGRKITGNEPYSPYRVVNVLGAAYDGTTGYFLVLAKPETWGSGWGDYVFPAVVKATWNSETFDWEPVSAFMAYDSEDELGRWTYPLHFGVRGRIPGLTGDTAVIDYHQGRVAVAWVEHLDHEGGTDPSVWAELRFRFALLDSNLNLIEQVRKAGPYPAGSSTYSGGTPITVILRHQGAEEQTAGAWFVGINVALTDDPNPSGMGWGDHGQDGLYAVYQVRWDGTGIIDDSSTFENVVDSYAYNYGDGQSAVHVADVRARWNDSLNKYELLVTRYSCHSDTEDTVFFPRVSLTLYRVGLDASVDNVAGASKLLVYNGEESYPWPALHAAVPVDVWSDGENWLGAMVVAYSLINQSGKHHGLWLKHVQLELNGTSSQLNVDPEGDPYVELDVELDDVEISEVVGWVMVYWPDDEKAAARRAYLRAYYSHRIRPVAYEFDSQNNEARFLLLHQGKSEWEAFSVAATRDGLLKLDGSALTSELVPKVAGGTYNEAEVWRPVVFEPEKRGDYSLASIPIVKKVCEFNVYSEPGKVGYKHLINPPTRYKCAVYNGGRLHLISRRPYWSFAPEEEIDYREKTNLDALGKSWEQACLGVSLVFAEVGAGTAGPQVKMTLLFHPRFPLRGDTHTVDGGNYWEESGVVDWSTVAERGFRVELFSRYWDAIVLGPQGGAILTNIWWDEEGSFNRELLVKVKDLSPAWFGLVQERVERYNTLFSDWSEGGTRWGMRAFWLPYFVGEDLPRLELGKILLVDLDLSELRGDPELGDLPSAGGSTVLSYWQITGYRVDFGRGLVLVKLEEVINAS